MYLSIFLSSRRRHTRFKCDWSSDVCSSDLDPGAGLLVRQFEVFGELPVSLGRFKRIEIGALEVFDQRQLDTLLIADAPDDNRHGMQSSHPGRLQTTLARNQA